MSTRDKSSADRRERSESGQTKSHDFFFFSFLQFIKPIYKFEGILSFLFLFLFPFLRINYITKSHEYSCADYLPRILIYFTEIPRTSTRACRAYVGKSSVSDQRALVKLGTHAGIFDIPRSRTASSHLDFIDISFVDNYGLCALR